MIGLGGWVFEFREKLKLSLSSSIYCVGKANSPSKTSKMEDHCFLLNCSHKCDFDNSLNKYICLCPTNLSLDKSGKMCVPGRHNDQQKIKSKTTMATREKITTKIATQSLIATTELLYTVQKEKIDKIENFMAKEAKNKDLPTLLPPLITSVVVLYIIIMNIIMFACFEKLLKASLMLP